LEAPLVDALRAEDVRVEHLDDLFGRERFGRPDNEVARVVNDDIDAALLAGDGLHRQVDGRLRQLSPRVRVFVDWVADQMRRGP
jgi:hypothetical protein